MSNLPPFAEARRSFHASLLENVLRASDGIPTNPDRGSLTSVELASRILAKLDKEAAGARMAGQMSGSAFEQAVGDFLRVTFPMVAQLRPGSWEIRQGGAKISDFEPYVHVPNVRATLRRDSELAAAIRSEFHIKPDVLILRHPEPDETINAGELIVGADVAERASLRQTVGGRTLLHALISCEWTLCSAYAEALNLIRTSEGEVPYIVTVTAEPLPSRLASISLGKGDFDVVYHIALPELLGSAEEYVAERPEAEDTLNLLRIMVDERRLRDIADLPLDLAV